MRFINSFERRKNDRTILLRVTFQLHFYAQYDGHRAPISGAKSGLKMGCSGPAKTDLLWRNSSALAMLPAIDHRRWT
jgi:hypothetical protein